MLRGLRTEIGDAIRSITFDFKPMASAMTKMAASIESRKGFDDVGIIKNLNRLEKAISKIDIKPQKSDADKIIKAIKNIKLQTKDIEFPDTINVGNFPPTKTPTPVTNININPLRGYIHTTAVTVSTSLTKLPSYGVLENRRAIIIYNNGANTIYVGGSTVTANTGLPIAASSYSPVLDAGVRMILYGRTSSGSSNVRCMEISNDAIGG
jgi:hypothetical protein